MGVPVIGCTCRVCRSTDEHDKRLRSSVSIEAEHGGHTTRLLIDCGIDFRQQMLRWPLPRIDAILQTHAHSDHISGIDDIRPFNYRQGGSLPFYSTALCLEDIEQRFRYAFHPAQEGGGLPRMELCVVEPGVPFLAGGVPVMPVELMHGIVPILGFRIGDFAYCTDCSAIPAASWELLQGLDTLIITALRREPHATHFSLAQSLEIAERLLVRRVFFTHIADDLLYEETNRELPPWARLAYDGLELTIEPARHSTPARDVQSAGRGR